jgi:hypothetical protein
MEQYVTEYVEKITQAVDHCARENPKEVFSAFAMYEDLANGIYAAGLDSLDNSLLHAKRQERYVHRLRQTMIQRTGWLDCCRQLASESGHPSIHDFNTSFSRFKYRGILSERVEKWVDRHDITAYHVMWLSWLVMDRLVENGCFGQLKLAQPFRLCFMSIDREDALVHRLLNWPPHSGPRV